MSPLSLYSVQAIIFLDEDGKRILSKYYSDSSSVEDVLFLDNRIVIYRNIGDVFVYVVGAADENELLLENIIVCLTNVLQKLIKNQFSKKSIVDQLDLVLLVLDELIDDGILLEGNPNVLYDTVSQLIKGRDSSIEISLTEESISRALAMAKEQLARSLLK
ncbi:snare-like protein [Rozella allomycis CSF55]|uniref:Coatomer subunit zeta n=1 Tax=Rozella allomycis (strain CSF55) TaxID=988480 RepID=A0A075ASU2_ROZAC|nr:Longin-like domain-containing protein [Rozella allomycis CSF55]RKP19036.1 snare-like protein [Rozella allomycis CSF55]|eukprot:EPZ33235.1 Longin-like domain-containing protein [Rozella allomycis CSF55]